MKHSFKCFINSLGVALVVLFCNSCATIASYEWKEESKESTTSNAKQDLVIMQNHESLASSDKAILSHNQEAEFASLPPQRLDTQEANLISGQDQEKIESVGFCQDDLYAEFLKEEYFKKIKNNRKFKTYKQLMAWQKKNTTRAHHYVAKTLVPTTSHAVSSIPVVRTPKVEFWINYFKTKGRETILKYFLRGEQIRHIVQPILKENGVPAELYYVAMMESGFNHKAFSRAKASGPWQFMRGTAKMYGLKINYWQDERKDLTKATQAAAKYLKDLYTRFGDWHLAIAAYNAGPGKISYALRKSKGKSFWDIAKTHYIRKETKHYVPKILAAIILGKNSGDHGFNIETEYIERYPNETIELARLVNLNEVAKNLDIPGHKIKYWNPELLREITPPASKFNKRKPYELRLPKEYIAKFHDIEDKLSNIKVSDVKIHKIQKGETLTSIAHRYKITLNKLLSFNKDISPRRLTIGKNIAIPIPSINYIN